MRGEGASLPLLYEMERGNFLLPFYYVENLETEEMEWTGGRSEEAGRKPRVRRAKKRQSRKRRARAESEDEGRSKKPEMKS